MKKHTPQRRGFSLVELLVVIAMIMLLMTLVAPSVYSYWVRAIRMKCQSNIKALAIACNNYAQDGPLHRNATRNTLPSTGATEDNWPHLTDSENTDTNGPGNAASLWLLIEYGHATPSVFVCPEAAHRMAYEAPDPETQNSFTYGRDATTTEDVDPRDAAGTTLSYSFLSLVGNVDPNPYDTETNSSGTEVHTYNPTPVIPVADATTIDSPFITNAMAIVGDMSPRGVKEGMLEDIAQDSDDAIVYANSYNHDGAGQNVGRMDMSAVWMTDPSEATADNIYTSDDDLAIRYDPATGMPLSEDPDTGDPIDPVSDQDKKDRVVPSVLGDAVLLPFRN